MKKSLRQISTIYFVALFLPLSSADPSEADCVYNLYVKTGSIMKAGTDSNISITLGDPSGRSVWVSNLESWGLMGPKHDYFERGSIDIFSGRGACIGAPVCRLNLTSDGSGSHHGWYCDYIEVSSTGNQRACRKTLFYVDQWLASDAPPFQLTVILDGCKMRDDGAHGPEKRGRIRDEPFVVGNPRTYAAW